MKRLILILLAVILILAVNTACNKFGEPAKAFQAYKESAEPETREEYNEERRLAHKRYGSAPTVPNVMSIDYKLISAESEGERPGRLNIHDVWMEKDEDGTWEAIEVEIRDLGERLK
jgi:hypothetical protein